MNALRWLLILVCMVGEAFFSGVETGVVSINRVRLRHALRRGVPSARVLHGFLETPNRLFGTTLVGTNVCVVVISVLSAAMAAAWWPGWGETISSLVVTMVLLMFCEYLPKAWFHGRPLERCSQFAGLLRAMEIALRPPARAVIWLSERIVAGPSKPFSKRAPFATREDLKVLAREVEKDGALSARERAMIHRVFELSGMKAREIMVPRAQMAFVNATAKVSELFELARKTDFTRMPVWDEKGEFVGVVNVMQVLTRPDAEGGKPVSAFMTPPLFIPEETPADDIFPKLRRFRQPMCLVRNAQSEVTGLVTTEDILEEIVGKIETGRRSGGAR